MDLHSKMTMHVTSTTNSPVTKTVKTSKCLESLAYITENKLFTFLSIRSFQKVRLVKGL